MAEPPLEGPAHLRRTAQQVTRAQQQVPKVHPAGGLLLFDVLDPRLATSGYGPFLRKSLPPFWFTTDGALVRQSLTRLDELASS